MNRAKNLLIRRLIVLVVICTIPLWLPFTMLEAGWLNHGRDLFRSLPQALRFIATGRRYD